MLRFRSLILSFASTFILSSHSLFACEDVEMEKLIAGLAACHTYEPFSEENAVQAALYMFSTLVSNVDGYVRPSVRSGSNLLPEYILIGSYLLAREEQMDPEIIKGILLETNFHEHRSVHNMLRTLFQTLQGQGEISLQEGQSKQDCAMCGVKRPCIQFAPLMQDRISVEKLSRIRPKAAIVEYNILGKIFYAALFEKNGMIFVDAPREGGSCQVFGNWNLLPPIQGSVIAVLVDSDQ